MPCKIAHRMDLFLDQEAATAIAIPKLIPVFVADCRKLLISKLECEVDCAKRISHDKSNNVKMSVFFIVII
jgi:hypothetical protein